MRISGSLPFFSLPCLVGRGVWRASGQRPPGKLVLQGGLMIRLPKPLDRPESTESQGGIRAVPCGTRAAGRRKRLTAFCGISEESNPAPCRPGFGRRGVKAPVGGPAAKGPRPGTMRNERPLRGTRRRPRRQARNNGCPPALLNAGGGGIKAGGMVPAGAGTAASASAGRRILFHSFPQKRGNVRVPDGTEDSTARAFHEHAEPGPAFRGGCAPLGCNRPASLGVAPSLSGTARPMGRPRSG